MEWISVKDRLPGFNIDVLAYSQYGEIRITCIDNSGGFDTYPFSSDVHEVTHWMPLPEPPKKRKSITQAFKELRESGAGEAWDKVKCVCAELGRGKCELNCPEWHE